MWTEPHAPSSLPAEKGHCHSAEEVASLNELVDLSGRSEAGLPRPGRSMTVASSRHLNLKLFGDFFVCVCWFCILLVVLSHWVFCLFLSRFHIWQPAPAPSQTTCSVPGQHECWCGSGYRADSTRPKGRNSHQAAWGLAPRPSLVGREGS